MFGYLYSYRQYPLIFFIHESSQFFFYVISFIQSILLVIFVNLSYCIVIRMIFTSSYGYNIWRDAYRPSQILKQICLKYDLGEPTYVGNKIKLAGITFEDTNILSSSMCIQIVDKLINLEFYFKIRDTEINKCIDLPFYNCVYTLSFNR